MTISSILPALSAALLLAAIPAPAQELPETPTNEPSPQRLGHLVLQVSDLARSRAFYQSVLQMKVTEEAQFEGRPRVFLSATDEHHELALVPAESPRDIPQAARWVQQIAFEVPNRQKLVEYLNTVQERSIPHELKDNGIAWSLYFSDPDGIKIELYWDIRDQPFGRQQWNAEQKDLAPHTLRNPPGG